MISTDIRSFIRVAPIFMMLFTAKAANTSDNAADLFQDAKQTAAQLKRDVGEMETYARSGVTWRAHSDQINIIRAHVNKAGQLAAQLERSRSTAAPWHQTAIDRLTPLLRELAGNIETMIEHINKQGDVRNPEYTKYLKANEDLANELSNLISDTVDYDKTKSEMQKP